MTQSDEARARGLLLRWGYNEPVEESVPEEFAELAAAFAEVRRQTAERSAKVADDLADHWGDVDDPSCRFHTGDVSEILMSVAQSIRSLAPEPPRGEKVMTEPLIHALPLEVLDG